MRAKLFAENIDANAIEQIEKMSTMPGLFKHIAIMPDVRIGYGMPIGSVAAFKDLVIPQAVGYDIGCGMAFIQTGLPSDYPIPDVSDIPMGFHHRSNDLPIPDRKYLDGTIMNYLLDGAEKQMGTLGGGNHFIEFQDFNGELCVMIHSGSRNIGKKVCEYFDKLALELNLKYYNKTYLPFLNVHTKEGSLYIEYMKWCLKFAKMNRETMMQIIQSKLNINVPILDCHHNYAAIESHYGEDVWVHRKGAVRAVGKVIIPGADGTNSYIGYGLENPESFNSCAHGAGRALGRKEANRQGFSDEDKRCYKDIDAVMEQQKTLVKPLMVLKTIKRFKGE